MKLVSMVVGGAALVAVAYGGYVVSERSNNAAPVAAPGQPPARSQPPAGEGQRRAGAAQGQPAPVVVTLARSATVPVTLAAIGNVQAYSTVAVKSQVDGQILEVHFKEGQKVKKGDLLFTLDPRPYEAALRQAEANLAKDKALLVKARADVERLRGLVARDFTSRANYEQAVANQASLEATVKADEAMVDQARLRLEHTRITAPMDGRVGSILINAGNLVKANDAAVGTLVTLNQVQPVNIQFAVPESHLAEIRARMAAGKIPVRAVVPGGAGSPAEGTLTFINNAVDTSTGTILLKAAYENADERLTPGQFVNVTMELARLRDAVVIPSSAVQQGQNGAFVFVVKDDNTAEVRLIRTGITADKDVVVESGLREGEKVVLEGQLRLRPGIRVTIRSTQAPAPPSRQTGQVPE
jgi:multidrug efflux system membrane fusion protein